MRLLGLLLIVFGAAVLVYGGMSYAKSRHTTDIGPVQVSTEKKGSIAPAVAGGIAVLVGVVLVVAGRRESV